MDPFDALSWSEATHFEFEGYDPSPFWDEDGTVYVTGAHAWQVRYVVCLCDVVPLGWGGILG